MNERSVLLEMLILESKGLLCISPHRIVELCCGWDEGVCDDDMLYEKYIEMYDMFFILNVSYIEDNVHTFGPSKVFENIRKHIDDGHDFKKSIINMIKNRFECSHIDLAEPPYEYLNDDIKERLKNNPNCLDIYMFSKKIEKGVISLEIV